MALGEGAHVVEAGSGEFGDGGFGAAGHHHIQIAVFDLAEGLANGVVGRGAGGDRCKVIALEAMLHGDHTAAHIGDHHGDKEGGNPVVSLLQRLDVFLLQGVDAADTAAQNDAHPEGILLFEFGAGVGEGQVGRRAGELAVPVHPAGLFLGNAIIHGLEVLDLRRQLDVKIAGVKVGDFINAADAGLDILPHGVYADPHWGHGANAGNHYSFHLIFHAFPSLAGQLCPPLAFSQQVKM